MVEQYPHLAIITVPGETLKDESGDYIQTPPQAIYSGNCRAEPNGAGETIRGEDGNEIHFSFIVYAPKIGVEMPSNADVDITIGLRNIKSTVKRHHDGQLNSRIWI